MVEVQLEHQHRKVELDCMSSSEGLELVLVREGARSSKGSEEETLGISSEFREAGEIDSCVGEL